MSTLVCSLGPSGCATDPCATPRSVATMELGGGATAFRTVTNGDAVAINCGPQGGYDLPTSLRFIGFDTDSATATLSAFDSTGTQVGFGSVAIGRVAMGDEVIGLPTYLGNASGFGGSDVVRRIRNTPIQWKASITDRCDATASDERTVTPTLSCNL